MSCCCFSVPDETQRETLNSISLTAQRGQARSSPTNSDSDRDKLTDKYPTRLLSDYIVNISADSEESIGKDYRHINSKLSSSWFSSNVTRNQSVETAEVLIKELAFQSGAFITEQLRNFCVPEKDSNIIKKSVQDQVDIVNECVNTNRALFTKLSLSNTFCCNLSLDQGDTSFIGMIIYGFVSTTSSRDKLKLVCCGHCEEWKISSFKSVQLGINPAAQIKNYLIHQLLLAVGAANYVSKDSPAAPSASEPGSAQSLDLDAFHKNMSRREIVKTLSLEKYPIYKVDRSGYLESGKGLMIGKHYVLLNQLGKGAFSKVFKAVNTSTSSSCAIKVIRNVEPFINAAKTELKVLQEIGAHSDNPYCVALQEHFEWKHHHCFVFPVHGASLLEVMSKNNFVPFPEDIARSIAYQVCKAIQFIHSLGIVFTDLKPENVIFADAALFTLSAEKSRAQMFLPFSSRIKLIDFGSAVHEVPKKGRKTFNNHLIQTRHYRAPEVVLGMAWTRHVDMWSLGCVIVELLNGHMVFITHCPIDHLYQMQKMIGPMPANLPRCASRGKYRELFHADDSLKMESAKKSKYEAKRLNHYFDHSKLEQLKLFDLVSRCLRWKATERIRCDQFDAHEWFQCVEDGMLEFDHQPNAIQLSEKDFPDVQRKRTVTV